MKKLLLPILTLSLALFSCQEEDEPITITAGDYPVKEYYLERNPSVNVWGAGMDFIHTEVNSEETDLDYTYFEEGDEKSYDVMLYTVKEYYYDDNDELQSQGCPAILLSADTKGCQVGTGIDFFDSLTVVTENMIAKLESDPQLDYDNFIDPEHGFYSQDLIAVALETCLIGQSFRSGILEVPEDKTEEEVQAVYLLQTVEGGYAKFMVKTFKPDQPNEKQTLVRWQVISE